MTAIEFTATRTRIFILVQSIIAMSIVFAYLGLVLTSREVPSDFSFIAGLVIAFFFDEVRRNGDQAKQINATDGARAFLSGQAAR